MRFVYVSWLLAALAIGCTTATPHAATPQAPAYALKDDGRMQVRADLWPKLSLASAERGEIAAEIEGVGRLEFAPDAAYAVRVPFAAYVEAVHVAAGAQVRANEPLATLRSGEVARLRSEARRLTATLAAQRDAVTRFKKLVRDGAASPRELVEAEAGLAGGEAELRGVRESLRAIQAGNEGADRFILRASADGQVLLRTLDPGERVTPEDDEPAFLIGDAVRLFATAAFPEHEAAGVREGADCTFSVPALGAERFPGKLVQVVQTLDRATRTAIAVCMPNATDPRLRGQMAVRVRAAVRGDGALVVPRSAVLLRRDALVVFVAVDEGVLERRTVALGSSFGDKVQIVEGLTAGETVVSENAVLLDGELDRLL
ncbi:efflux RND transporter periplasmic adaptor subunit [Nannocystis bainbridge]|uniref:Efflux RND transporter periplasmic adaptor subunit n=1 Tax=Nannocystis bainbridge TaxID=2995303 RepID=A0ABT5EA43_9BACT|nr:efflux RND transporter periplasmic adaptor subunit [Nannocystis bainbridge]MDC0721651.1 efflux RND transporter periplasmic adaptor subunit [Nannocystis bainbridge]